MLFPAEAQYYTGVYKLTVVAKVYEPGYSLDNLRTITMDYENVFKLVDTSDGADCAATLDVIPVGCRNVNKITVSGDTYVGVDQYGSLVARVEPVDAIDTSVTWKVDGNDIRYLAIANAEANSCRYIALGLPDGAETYTATIHVISNDNPSIKQDIQIIIGSSLSSDVYVDSAQFDDDTISLHRTDNDHVDINLGEAVGWYEDDNQ